MTCRFIFIFSIIYVSAISFIGVADDSTFREQMEKMKADYHLQNEPYFEKCLEWTRNFEPAQEFQKERNGFQKQLLDLFKFFVELHPTDRNIYFLLVEIFANYQMEYPTLEKWLHEIRSFDRLFTKAGSLKDQLSSVLPYSLNPELGEYYRYFLHLKRLDCLPPWEEFRRELRDIQNEFSKKDYGPDKKPLFLWEGRFYPDVKEQMDEEKKKLLSGPIIWKYDDLGRELSIESTFYLQRDSQKVENKILKDPQELFQRFFPWQLMESETRYHPDDDGRDILSVAMIDIDGDRLDLNFLVHNDTSNGFGKNALYFTLEPPTWSALNGLLSLWEITCKVRPHEKFGDVTTISLKSKTEVRTIAMWFKSRLTREGEPITTKQILEKELPGKLSGLRDYLLKE